MAAQGLETGPSVRSNQPNKKMKQEQIQDQSHSRFTGAALKSMLIIAAMAATACSSVSKNSANVSTPSPRPMPAEAMRAAKSNPTTTTEPKMSWQLVSRNPDIFIPEGMSVHASRGFDDGEWVVSKARNGRWFIPTKGTPKADRKTIEKEALAMRTELEKSKIAFEEGVHEVGCFTVKATLTTAYYVLMAIGHMSP